jgi:dynein heavy chain 2, cytosolic
MCSVKGNAGFVEVAMGQDQTGRALDMLQSCAASGEWLFLKNVHLVMSWLPRLEQAVHSLKAAPGFRLWLTSEVASTFPPTLLENCLVRHPQI